MPITGDARRRSRKALYVMGLLTFVSVAAAGTRALSPKLFDEVFWLVSERFQEQIGADSLAVKAARGLLDELGDPYASLFSPKDLERFEKQQIGNHYGGLGMILEDLGDVVFVQRVFDGPARRAGIRVGDQIVEVDGVNLRDSNVAAVSSRVTGEPGTTVHVSVAHPPSSATRKLTLTRAAVHTPAVPFSTILSGSVGYVPLVTFSESSAEEVTRAVESLKTRGATSIVLDLRGNGGGELNAAVDVAAEFLPMGSPVVRVDERATGPTLFRTKRQGDVTTPLVVLVDYSTASAAEILAGALQDADRALLLGSTTYGKGVVQSAYRLSSGWAVKLTTGKWFTPAGRSIDRARRIDQTGTIVPAVPDSVLEKTRPTIKTKTGRTLVGGGGIVPDVHTSADTSTRDERALAAALRTFPSTSRVIRRIAFAIRDSVGHDFKVDRTLRDRVYDSLVTAGARLGRDVFDRGASAIDRALEQTVVDMAFGDSTAFVNTRGVDSALEDAVRRLRSARNMAQLLSSAARDARSH